MRRTDLIGAAILCALGLLTIVVLIPSHVAPGGASGDLPPAFMPYVAAVLATGAAALLLAARLPRAAPDDSPAPLSKRSWLFIATVSVLLLAAFVVMQRFGYLAGAAIVVAGFMAMARARWPVVAGTAIAFPLVLWLLFDGLLGFPLP